VGGAVVVVLLVGWLALRGGGGSSQDAETERRLAKVIAGTGVVTRQQADCIAEEIVDRVGSDELSQIDDLTQMPDDLSQEFVDALTAAQAQALDACGAAGAGTGG
jgi:ABC-type branched-subunit amino acid transport system substrate-binding protein